MSPTYWTASQIKAAARAHGWEFVPVRPADPDKAWGARKGRHLVMFKENAIGGLVWVRFTYPVSDGSNCDHFGPRCRNKLAEVLAFLEDPTQWKESHVSPTSYPAPPIPGAGQGDPIHAAATP